MHLIKNMTQTTSCHDYFGDNSPQYMWFSPVAIAYVNIYFAHKNK